MISLDTETTGLDIRHGAKPFLVTICNEEGENTFWEWDVDPYTRQPSVPKDDLREIANEIDRANTLILQNPKFDFTALSALGIEPQEGWPWHKVYDTLLAGHLLASNQPHDLTTMVLMYLGVNVQPYEDAIKEATKECRRLCQGKKPKHDWRIANANEPDMPSAKATTWKYDMWLPRFVVLDCVRRLDFGNLPSDPQQPTVGRINKCKVPIGRGTKWGNPYKIGPDGNCREVILKYADYVLKSDLMDNLPELYGQVLGCYCSPKLCHGDILRALCHPWRTVCSEYANSDSASTLQLFKRQRELLKKRGLWRIYKERMKIPPIISKMEDFGVTLNKPRLEEQETEYRRESVTAGRTCLAIARKRGKELTLPKSGNNASLLSFVFDEDGLDLPPKKRSQKTGKPSLDKSVIDDYLATLPKGSPGLRFVEALRAKRKRDTVLGFMASYRKFWLVWDGYTYNPEMTYDEVDWHRLHPSLNPTGTDTLRFACSNPNTQQVSKQEEFNIRYCFGPAPGREWWCLDAKNLELRIPAYEVNEREMVELFERADEGPYYGSVHSLMFHIVYPKEFEACDGDVKDQEPTKYGKVKTGDFAVQYGSVEQSGTADRAYGVKGAFERVKRRFRKIHGPGGLNERMIAYAQKHGYVETMPDKTVDPKRGYPLYCSRSRWGKVLPTVPLNYHVQGTAMWWMMKAMIRCQEYLDTLNGHYMVMQVHDEIVFDFPKSKCSLGKTTKKYIGSQHLFNLSKIRKIARLMEQGGDDIGVPTPVSIEYHGETWSEGVPL